MKVSMTLRSRREFLRQVYVITISICAFIQLASFVNALVHPQKFIPVYKLITFTPIVFLLTIGLLQIQKIKASVLSWYFIVCCYSTLIYYTATTGGLIAPGIIWFLICPIVSFFILSKQQAKLWLCIVLITLCVFFVFESVLVVNTYNGKSFWYLLSYLLFFTTLFRISQIFIKRIDEKTSTLMVLNNNLVEKQVGLLIAQAEIKNQNDKLKTAEQHAVARTERLEMYLNRMWNITRMEELQTGNLIYATQSLEQNLREVLSLQCVSVWKYDELESTFHAISKHSEPNKLSRAVASFEKKELRRTVELLEAGAIVHLADLTCEEEITRLTHYLGVSSAVGDILTCPFFIDGKFYGMIACVTFEKRNWATEDIIFIIAITDALCLSFKSDQRRENELLLQDKQREISELNESLEEKVSTRSMELKLRNEQLLNFAFINAHQIRGPICRLMGLCKLLKMNDEPDEVERVYRYINTSVQELDEITRRASKLLAEDMPEEWNV